ncbi:MAG: HAD hydrolase-like protein [Oscillospiraceae bacterium]|nr:HAD hydrolase-like protein [Oscillospiraceae bacterium]
MTQLKPFYYSHIIWDWNGTLLDDLQPSVGAVNEILKSQACAPLTVFEYQNLMEAPIKSFYKKIVNFEKLSFLQAIEMYSCAYEKYAGNCNLRSGARQVLELLEAMGSTQMIVSACEEKRLLTQAARLEILQYFDTVLAADNACGESKIERAVRYFEQKEAEMQDVVVIGDTTHDFELAKELGCECVLIAGGHEDVEHLLKCDALVFNSLQEFLWYVQDSVQQLAG